MSCICIGEAETMDFVLRRLALRLLNDVRRPFLRLTLTCMRFLYVGRGCGLALLAGVCGEQRPRSAGPSKPRVARDVGATSEEEDQRQSSESQV